MDYLQAFAISAAGMSAERTRVDIAALNMANANTIQTTDGVSYQPLRALTLAVPAATALPGEFADQVNTGLDGADPTELTGLNVPQVSIEPTEAAPRMVYEPGNPFADSKGFVSYPGVDTTTEMIGMMNALRSYEANVAAMNMAKTLALKALDIGGTES